MKASICLITILLAFSSSISADTQADESLPLSLLYLATYDPDRTESFQEFFEQRFQSASVIERGDFEPPQAANYDVVVLDWPQSERLSGEYESPLGDLDDWNTPTVFLGSAGHLLAGPWEVIGGSG